MQQTTTRMTYQAIQLFPYHDVLTDHRCKYRLAVKHTYQ